MKARGWWSWAAALLVAGAVGGCSAVGTMSPEADQGAKALKPPEGKALVYVVRPASLGLAVSMEVKCDDRSVGTTGGKRFVYTVVEPGEHLIRSKAENWSEVKLSAEAGKTYFLEQKVRMGFLAARNTLVLLEEAEGRQKLTQCTLSSDLAAPEAPAQPPAK